ncbi:MAG: cupin domain-containing protein [Methanomicrobiales archaeon]|jgi:quercetin dioxygenase-like cupin family protein|nr:cupin domain-containing protein [Methanomicrobiales archaeon]
MHRVAYLILICTIISCGCITQSPSPAEETGIRLLTPTAGFPIFDGQGHYAGIIGQETPDITINYSMGLVTLAPGNVLPPHRLLGTTEMICILQGAAEIRCDNVTISAREGEVVVLPADVLRSTKATGNTSLKFIDVIQPPFAPEIEISDADLSECTVQTDGAPIIISDPRGGIEWDIGSDMMIYSLANPALMPEAHFPIDYSLAYAELLPGGGADTNRFTGASEVIYVIEGEIEVFTPAGTVITVPAGSAVYIAPEQKKGYRNAGETVAAILSFVDPAWTPELVDWAV